MQKAVGGSAPRGPVMWNVEQAGAVPFRYVDSRPQFLLVTSRRGNWIFPKGVVEPGDTAEETARKETLEEAGILGHVLPRPIGSYSDRKSWSPCRVRMYLLHYDGDSPQWSESSHRAKRWCSYENALGLIKKKELRELLQLAWKRLEQRADGARDPEGSFKRTSRN